MGGPGEICLPLNIAFAPSTWVALSLLAEGLSPPLSFLLPLPRAPSERSHKFVSCPRSSKESDARSCAMATEIFIFNATQTRSFILGIDSCEGDEKRGGRALTSRDKCIS